MLPTYSSLRIRGLDFLSANVAILGLIENARPLFFGQ